MSISNRRTGKYDKLINATDDDIRGIVESEIKRFGVHANLNHVLVDEVTDISCLFRDLDFDGDISQWNVGKVTDMSYAFERSTFNGDISDWSVRNVRKHDHCFDGSPLEQQPNKQPKFNP